MVMLVMLLWLVVVVVVLGWLIYIKRPSGLLVNNSITFLACPGSQNFDNPAQNTFSRAVTVKPGRKGGFDSETTPRECRGEVDVEEVGCQCCCCGFGGRDFVIFFGDAGRSNPEYELVMQSK